MYGSIFVLLRAMKHFYQFCHSFTVFLLLTSCAAAAQNSFSLRTDKDYQILYFNPEIFPDIEEIKEPTYAAFFSALSDQVSAARAGRLLRVDYNIVYDSPSTDLIAEFCENNNAQFAVLPKVKYFKVGLGKYVFSNQVIVSLKIFDAAGALVAETSYDTYRKGGRMLGSAENSIKAGTLGALKDINKQLRKKYRSSVKAAGLNLKDQNQPVLTAI